MLLLLLKNRQWDVCTGRRCSAKETVFGSFPNFCYPERSPGLNRINHPDWVKLCVELHYAPNQNTKISSATHIQLFELINVLTFFILFDGLFSSSEFILIFLFFFFFFHVWPVYHPVFWWNSAIINTRLGKVGKKSILLIAGLPKLFSWGALCKKN